MNIDIEKVTDEIADLYAYAPDDWVTATELRYQVAA